MSIADVCCLVQLHFLSWNKQVKFSYEEDYETFDGSQNNQEHDADVVDDERLNLRGYVNGKQH